jgi:N4-(beta-N-acetylglucosaminyl)-L-asparaginase
MATTRRDFVTRTAFGAAVGLNAFEALAQTGRDPGPPLKPPSHPVIVTRETGDSTIAEAYQMLLDGEDTLTAAQHICLGRENDPSDHSVGYGGLPNEDGVVELDACCMHGPTRQAGSVGALHNIRNACLVSRRIMEQTSHVMLVGEGAERFAVAQGFKREDMLTDDARKIWLLWKEGHSNRDFWGPGMASPSWKDPMAPGETSTQSILMRHPSLEQSNAHREALMARSARLQAMAADLGIPADKRWTAVEQVLWPTTGTIHVSVVNAKGEISGATTTSGQAFKLPGRLGDSPIIGAGCYTDQDIGSAGATGSGEENIKVAGAHTIVELMRAGMSPRDAGLETLRRIVRNYNGDMNKVRYLDMIYYIVRKDGAYAGVSLWSTTATGKPRKFAVHDGNGGRSEACVALLQGTNISWPPI